MNAFARLRIGDDTATLTVPGVAPLVYTAITGDVNEYLHLAATFVLGCRWEITGQWTRTSDGWELSITKENR